MSEMFDFGFTAVDENELEVVQKASTTAQTATQSIEALESKVNDLYNFCKTYSSKKPDEMFPKF